MNDLLITGAQLEQIISYLNEQPHKFSAPLIGYINGLIAASQPQPVAAEAEEPAAERE